MQHTKALYIYNKHNVYQTQNTTAEDLSLKQNASEPKTVMFQTTYKQDAQLPESNGAACIYQVIYLKTIKILHLHR